MTSAATQVEIKPSLEMTVFFPEPGMRKLNESNIIYLFSFSSSELFITNLLSHTWESIRHEDVLFFLHTLHHEAQEKMRSCELSVSGRVPNISQHLIWHEQDDALK